MLNENRFLGTFRGHNTRTKRVGNVLVGVFKKWAGRAALRNIGEDMETYEVLELDKFTINLRINFALYDLQVIA